MVLMTMIARVVDGLPLAATMQEDEQSGYNILEYQNQAKMLFRKLGPQSPLRCSIETGPFLFHYLIENDICYLVLCERNYSKKLAFSYLEEIAQEFHLQYGKRSQIKQPNRRRSSKPEAHHEITVIPSLFHYPYSIKVSNGLANLCAWQPSTNEVNTVTRPYTFIEFDTWMQRTRRQYTEGGARARRAGAGATAQLGGQLNDVQRIMMQNIDDVLQRGAVLSELDTKTQNLSMMSSKYRQDAAYLNTKSLLVKVTAGAVIILVFVLYFWIL